MIILNCKTLILVSGPAEIYPVLKNWQTAGPNVLHGEKVFAKIPNMSHTCQCVCKDAEDEESDDATFQEDDASESLVEDDGDSHTCIHAYTHTYIHTSLHIYLYIYGKVHRLFLHVKVTRPLA